MADLAKVIKGLECCLPKQDCDNCPYDKENESMAASIGRALYETAGKDTTIFDIYCMVVLQKDALALLKEQEPRVLTLDEAVDGTQVYYVEFQYHLDRGWVKCDFDRMYVDGEVAMLFLRDKTFYQQKEHYGQLWRLWNRRPTDEQMKAVKWE